MSMSCHELKSAPSSNVASAPVRWRRNTSTATRHCFGPQGDRCCDVPPPVVPRLDGFPVLSHRGGIMLLREKLDRFREALWAELLGIRKEQTDRLNSLLAKATTCPDARKRRVSDARGVSQIWLIHRDLLHVSVRCRTASASALA